MQCMEKYVTCALIRAAPIRRLSARHFPCIRACVVRALAPVLNSTVS
jgi:hypothetical protein